MAFESHCEPEATTCYQYKRNGSETRLSSVLPATRRSERTVEEVCGEITLNKCNQHQDLKQLLIASLAKYGQCYNTRALALSGLIVFVLLQVEVQASVQQDDRRAAALSSSSRR